MSFIAAFICCTMKKGRQILIKTHKQSKLKQLELWGMLSFCAAHYFADVMIAESFFKKKKMYTSAHPHDRCKCFMVTGFI